MLRRLAIIAGALGLVTSAAAQIAPTEAPVDFSSVAEQWDPSTCTMALTGQVELLQDEARFRADSVRITSKKLPDGDCSDELQTIVAEGNLFYVTLQQRVRAGRAVYDAASDSITFTQDVVATRGQSVLTGQSVLVKVSTGETTVTGGPQGRVRGILYPQKSDPKSIP